MGEGLHAAHQAILQQGGPVGFQPYRRPLKFPLRVGNIGWTFNPLDNLLAFFFDSVVVSGNTTICCIICRK